MSEKVYYKTHSGGNETQTKKFLDYEGVKYLWSKINMQDYPNNETLMAVINAIDETKMDNLETVIFSGEYTAQSGKINFPDLTDKMIGKIGVLYNYGKIIDFNIIQSDREPGSSSSSYPSWEGVNFSYYPYWHSENGWHTNLEDNTTSHYTFSVVSPLKDIYIPKTIARTYQIPDVPVKSVNGMIGDVIIDIPKGFSGSWNDLENKPTTTKYQDELLISRTDLENKYYFNLPDKFHLSGEHTYKAYLKNRYNYGYITISGYESTNMLSIDLIFKNSSNNILFTARGNSSGKMRFTDLSDFNNETLIIYSGEELMDHIIPDTIARVSDIPIIQIITWEADD